MIDGVPTMSEQARALDVAVRGPRPVRVTMLHGTKDRDGEVGRALREFIGNIVREAVEAALDARQSKPLDEPRSAEARRPPEVKRPARASNAPSPITPEYLTRKQVAALTGYSLRTISRFIERRVLKVCGPRLDRVRRFELERFMDKHPKGAGSDEDGELDADTVAALDEAFEDID